MKISSIVLALLVCQIVYLTAPPAAFCQTETFDIIHYTPPKGWTKSQKEGVIIFSDQNKPSGGFCVLTVYSSTPSSGSPQRDFASKWNELIVKPFKADANPKTESETQDGWTVVAGSAAIESDGVKSVVLMTVLSGYGKVVNTFAIINDQSYLPALADFVSSIKLDKTPAKGASIPASDPQGIDARANDPFPDRPGYEPQKPLSGILKPSISIADLVGTWNQGAGSVKTYVDAYTGNYAGTNTTFYGEEYVIHADGSFDYRFAGRSSNYTVKEGDRGTVVLSGGFVEFKFKGRSATKYQFIAFNVQPSGVAILTLVPVHDTFQGYDAAGMRLECGHYDSFIGCVGGEQWARLRAQ